MSNLEDREHPPVTETGTAATEATIKSRLAMLGHVSCGRELSFIDGAAAEHEPYKFMPDTPLGRANLLYGENVAGLDAVISAAESLDYARFASTYPDFGPYES